MLVRGGTGLALALGAALLAVVPSTSAAAVGPTTCPFPAANTYEWIGGTDGTWGTAGNWTVPPSYDATPNDFGDPEPDTQPSYACIPAGVTVHLTDATDFMVYVEGLWLAGGSTIDVQKGTGLFVMGSTESFAGSGSTITVSGGSLGGEGTLRSEGVVTVASGFDGAASISSTSVSVGPPAVTTPGHLVIDAGGHLSLPNLGVNLQRGYQVELRNGGTATVSGSGAIAANDGTGFTIQPGSQLHLAGPGGYYQGQFLDPRQLSDLVNHGRILKTGAGTTSVIDADYQGSGRIDVDSGTVAFPDGTTYQAQVAPGQRFSTEKCRLGSPSNAPCPLETDPANDPEALSFRVPPTNGGRAAVTVDELPTATAPVSNAILYADAHAEGMRVDAGDPGLVEMRVAASRAAGVPTDWLGVYHLSDGDQGGGQRLPSCQYASGAPPPGWSSCVDRRGTADGTRLGADGNYYVVVRTTTTSRWIIRKEDGDVTAPTLLTPEKQKKGQLGKTVKVRTGCTETCILKATGFLKVSGEKIRLTRVKKKSGALQVKVLKLRLGRAALKVLNGLDATRGTATIKLTATDGANKTVQTITVKLR